MQLISYLKFNRENRIEYSFVQGFNINLLLNCLLQDKLPDFFCKILPLKEE